MIRAFGRRSQTVFLVPLFLGPTLHATPQAPTSAPAVGIDHLGAAVQELTYAKAHGAPRARIDRLFERLEAVAAAAGTSAAQALAQCGPVPTAPPTNQPHPIAAPPCSGGTTTTVTFSSSDILPIPDATTTAQSGWGTLENFIFASGLDSFLWDVDVRTNIAHARCNDLKMYLLGPNGQQVTLTTDNNLFGYANLFNGTRWDDSALVPVTDWPFVNNQVVGPCVPEGALGAYVGIDPNGVWDLLVRDDTPNNTGALQGWSVDLTTISAPPTLSGGSYFKLVNQVIPDAPSTGLVSTLVVTGSDNFLVDVNITTVIQHPFPSDIAIYLVSPAGTTVTLSTRNGGNRDDVYNGTMWDDSAPLCATDYPYVPGVVAPLLCPDGALSALMGENPNGTWTLRVRDDLAGEVGFVTAWALDTLTCVPPSPGTPFCTGDGLDGQITSTCPCGNVGAAGNGCANSANAAGAHLSVTGSTNPDTAVLHASGMPATAFAIYLKGDVLDDVVFGDGIRCTGGNLIRMRTRVSVAGASQFPDVGDPLLSVRGATPVGSGLTAYYQTYYRNAVAAFCPPATFNIGNGVRMTW
ncbi:MAG: proprotein convertase P-domain-containing protein [Planctomycetes bacterium]|nr:proprotein convertase P-domain-containing protein [Planctomycetota bacterium]